VSGALPVGGAAEPLAALTHPLTHLRARVAAHPARPWCPFALKGHVAEAEQLYRADLGLDNTFSRGLQHPLNLPRLHGYVECLTLQGKHTEAAAAQARLKLAMAHADVPIHASCYCRGEKSCCD